MKAFITKWALTEGILEVDGTPFEPDRKLLTWGCGFSQSAYGEGSQWHTDRQKAVYRAQQMRVTKIESLKKQISKLEAMTFE